ncbi:hypothetical protein LUZ61_001783 [Rhynchospora tenuis]|uniref:ARM repeat superfamily protein n=1 Tax=Rhynchospora tenuis TaxID=198213 RepID=A0AAD5ZHV0_9POAL|nr:hypothetical protein LUZ61_001783 [Rhynchospora tenuis]
MKEITEINTRNNTNGVEVVVEKNVHEPKTPNHFEPRAGGSDIGSSDAGIGADHPERKVTLFALHLAFLEKAATLLSTICFVWATVVLLGGFAVTLEIRDFWFVTTILLVEATRVFGRSHELELQENPVWIPIESITTPEAAPATGTSDLTPPTPPSSTLVAERSSSGHSSDFSLVPFGGRLFMSGNIRNLLYWIQVLSATACVVLSLIRLVEQNFGATHGSESEHTNRNSALNIFYSLALAEALTFLIERAYREWKFNYEKLIRTVSEELTLGEYGEESIKRFFYRAYSKSMSGSILDSIKMDMVSFAQELLISNSHEEQLIGVHVLKSFVTSDELSSTTLKKIATSTTVVERLIDMLNWKNKTQIRYMAAEIVLRITGKRQNVLRITRIPGSIESIAALLDSRYPNIDSTGSNYHDNGFSKFNEIGLRIIKKLARDHANADAIGIRIVQESLNVLRELVGTVGHTGRKLRNEISDNIFLLANLRKLLIHGMLHPNLQTVAIEILMDLAMDEVAAEKIGSTGGIIPQLLLMFTDMSFSESVRSKAGHGLAFIALGSEENCLRIIREDNIDQLVQLLRPDSKLQLNSSRVMLNLCTYTKDQHWSSLQGIISIIPMVIQTIMHKEDKRLLEVSIGLAAQLIKHANEEDYHREMKQTGFTEDAIARKLVDLIRIFRSPKVEVPRIRRFIIELTIAMMKKNGKLIQIFDNMGIQSELRVVQRSTSEIENFGVFSGSIGLNRYNVPLSSLIDDAIKLIANGRSTVA